jgi:N-dimethylarginine dimethylaminohydrolase
MTNVYNSAHIDSTIVPIDEDYVVLNASRVNEDTLPWFIQDMKKIWITENMVNPQSFTGYPYASKWIAMNMLSLGDKRVICDAHQPKIHEALKEHGFHVIPLELRHARTLGGGFHCVTLDLLRE